ncbi:MAG: DNA-processing protein DprA [Clostridia bacterium]|nr:DNA-processing protein DprA [Clostridia bacterium]
MAGAEYWIWLQKAFGPRSTLACKLVEHFGDPEKLYCAGRKEWLASGIVKEAQCDKLCLESPSQSIDVMMQCLKYQLDIVTPDSPYYPPQLLKMKDYPLVLYVLGRTTSLQAPVMTAVVGTRKASRGGDRFAREMTAQLARAGVAVVSGGALGIDTAAHEGALSANGITIVVMGCGLGHDYLMQNEAMRKLASEKGAVISEFLPETPPSKVSFPIRNRILAGLSQATVVIEAAEKSGSFITAGDALHLQRMVLAVPSEVTGSFYSGTDKLIRENKAYSVSSAGDVIRLLRMQNGDWSEAYDKVYNAPPVGVPVDSSDLPEELRHLTIRSDEDVFTASPKPKRENTKTKQKKIIVPEEIVPAAQVQTAPAIPSVPAWLTEDLLPVWNALQDGQKSPDELIRITGLPPGKVMIAISKLEYKNAVERDFGSVRLK